MGHEAIRKILEPLIFAPQYIRIIEEFDERRTDEARFAYQCDKLEADLTAFKYDMEKKSFLVNAADELKNNPEIKQFSDLGATCMSEFFYYYDRNKYDANFREVLEKMFQRANL